MSDFKTLKGLYIKHVSSDPPSPIEGEIWYNTTSQTLKVAPQIAAWASGGNVNTARSQHGGAGTQTASLAFGGNPIVAINESYDGSSWTESPDLSTARRLVGGCGTQTSALCSGGIASPGTVNSTEEFDGSSWTAGGNYTAAAYGIGTGGTQTAAFGAGYAPYTANSAEYDGSSWTAGS